jgi:hypothetical protein
VVYLTYIHLPDRKFRTRDVGRINAYFWYAYLTCISVPHRNYRGVGWLSASFWYIYLTYIHLPDRKFRNSMDVGRINAYFWYALVSACHTGTMGE